MCACFVCSCVVCYFPRDPVVCKLVFVSSSVARHGGRVRFMVRILFWCDVGDFGNIR